jgi:hypothetical protein
MLKTYLLLVVIFLQPSLILKAQTETKYSFDKPGNWSFSNRISKSDPEFIKNLEGVAGWFRQKVPMMADPKGFDLVASIFNCGSNNYEKRPCNYGIPGNLYFEFQLFFNEKHGGGKWKIEPPAFSFYVNDTETGHGSNGNYNGYDYREEAASLEVPINKATGNLNDLFLVFPLVQEFAPGVRLYGDGNLIVFNPDQPDFWIPVTVRQVAEMKLEYFSLKKDILLLPYLKKEMDKLSAEELNAPAYDGNAELFVLNVNGKRKGLQIMRFNPEYWDRSLPRSAIQYMTFWYPQLSEAETEEYFKNNLHPHYGQLVMNSIKPEDLAGLIVRKK